MLRLEKKKKLSSLGKRKPDLLPVRMEFLSPEKRNQFFLTDMEQN